MWFRIPGWHPVDQQLHFQDLSGTFRNFRRCCLSKLLHITYRYTKIAHCDTWGGSSSHVWPTESLSQLSQTFGSHHVDSRSWSRSNIYPKFHGSRYRLKLNHIQYVMNSHDFSNHLLTYHQISPSFPMGFPVFPCVSHGFPMKDPQIAGFGTLWPGPYSGPRAKRIAATRTAMRFSEEFGEKFCSGLLQVFDDVFVS